MYGQYFESTIESYHNWITSDRELHIWRGIIGHIDFNQFITSPVRIDSEPKSCYIESYHNRAILVDWSSGDRIGASKAIQRILKCSYADACSYAYKIYKGFNFNSIYRRSKFYKIEKSNDFKSLENPTITYQTFRRSNTPAFSTKGKEYWKNLGLDNPPKDVHDVYSISINEKIIFPTYPTFAYYFNNGNFKLYSPNAVKHKWYCTTNKNDVWVRGNGNKLIITKSKKDLEVLFNLFPEYTIMAFQNEAIIPDNIETELKNYSKSYVVYDNDSAGKKGSKILENLECEPIFFNVLDGKDASEVYLNKGKNYLINYLKDKLC